MPIRNVVTLHCEADGCVEQIFAAADTVYLFKYGHIVRKVYAPHLWTVRQDGTGDHDYRWRAWCPFHSHLATEERSVADNDDMPIRVELRDESSGTTFFVELHRPPVGSHGHEPADAFWARVVLIAHNKGGFGRGQAIAALKDVAAALSRADVVEPE